MQNGQDLVAAGNAARMVNGGREPGVVPVELGLRGSVRIHLEEGLGKYLPPVVVVPAGIDDATVFP